MSKRHTFTPLSVVAERVVRRLEQQKKKVRTAAGEDHRRPQAGAKGGRSASKDGEGDDLSQGPPRLIRKQQARGSVCVLAVELVNDERKIDRL